MNSRGNSSWTDLNEALLDRIFALVCSPLEGLEPDAAEVPFLLKNNLPLVCRRFNALYKSSPTLWRHVKLNWATAINPPGVERRLSSWAEERSTRHSYTAASNTTESEIPRFGYIARWLLSRASLIQHLTLTNCHILGPALEIQLLPLCSQASRLVSLQLLDYKGSGDEVLAAISASASSTLTRIKLTCHRPTRGHTIPLRVSGSALQELVNNLPVVESVDLEIDSLTSRGGQVALDQNAYWFNLEKLTSFRLNGRLESVVMHPEMLSSLKNLQNLQLTNVRLPQFSPAMVAALSQVSFLSLENVLAAKPRRKSGFALWNALPGLQSLKKLVVIGAGRDAELPRSALACWTLKSLSIENCSDVGHWPLSADIPNPGQKIAYPAVDTLQHLSLVDVGLSMEMPSVTFWRHCRSLTSLTWRNVHQAAPRHRYWDHGGACELSSAMEPVLRMLRVLCLEFSGMNEEQLTSTAGVLHFAIKLKELSLTGNRFGGLHGIEIANAIIHDKMELERLFLINCGLKSVPGDIFSLSSLNHVDLSNNPRLETSEEEDEKLKKIEVVKRNDRQAVLAAALPKVSTSENKESAGAAAALEV